MYMCSIYRKRTRLGYWRYLVCLDSGYPCPWCVRRSASSKPATIFLKATTHSPSSWVCISVACVLVSLLTPLPLRTHLPTEPLAACLLPLRTPLPPSIACRHHHPHPPSSRPPSRHNYIGGQHTTAPRVTSPPCRNSSRSSSKTTTTTATITQPLFQRRIIHASKSISSAATL
jgi:hypothetical protein